MKSANIILLFCWISFYMKKIPQNKVDIYKIYYV